MSTEHERIRELLHAYVDGELDLANARETERHLRSCADCRGTEKAIRELRSALTSEATAYRAPAHLRRNVRAALRREAKSSRQILSPGSRLRREQRSPQFSSDSCFSKRRGQHEPTQSLTR